MPLDGAGGMDPPAAAAGGAAAAASKTVKRYRREVGVRLVSGFPVPRCTPGSGLVLASHHQHSRTHVLLIQNHMNASMATWMLVCSFMHGLQCAYVGKGCTHRVDDVPPVCQELDKEDEDNAFAIVAEEGEE